MGLAKMENETDASASNIERKRPAAQRRTPLYGGARLQRCQEKRYKMSISNKNGLKRQGPSCNPPTGRLCMRIACHEGKREAFPL
ncbi:hypothetical protein DPX39_010013300 [Trypanosoma brucei equiperdum]|uniref:Uncharacterized protein n=1 Tax=Trypanosoma brucei equiperdum TaxID=630700 RepID=A0A3L6LC69_9TRYP|nr:hypothetical protein DPX39_010013300 [Trypanosoma brucei equiperdum]